MNVGSNENKIKIRTEKIGECEKKIGPDGAEKKKKKRDCIG